MNSKYLSQISPISARHHQQSNKDETLSSYWNHVMPRQTNKIKTRNQQQQINFLKARNKMARTLDCIFAKRVRFPFQIIKQKILFSQSDLSISYSKQSQTNNIHSEQLTCALQIINGVVSKNNQKQKMYAFSSLKAEMYQQSNQNDTYEQYLNQVLEGSDKIVQILRFNVIRSLRHFFNALISSQKFEQKSQKSKYHHEKNQSTYVDSKKYIHPTKVQLIRSPLCQKSNNQISQDYFQKQQQKIVQYLYVMRDKSHSKNSKTQRYNSRQKFLKIPLVPGIQQIMKQPPSNRRKKQSTQRFFFKKNKQSHLCSQHFSNKLDTCKFCKLFITQSKNNQYTSRPSKYNFFNK